MITKNFVEIYETDTSGYNGEWVVTDKTYAAAIKMLDGWRDAVRVVEKTFNPDTFEITTRTLRKIEKDYEGNYAWHGKLKETIYAG